MLITLPVDTAYGILYTLLQSVWIGRILYLAIHDPLPGYSDERSETQHPFPVAVFVRSKRLKCNIDWRMGRFRSAVRRRKGGEVNVSHMSYCTRSTAHSAH